ncbi:Asp-tRNA(Asn)/Glu-tRNA(Gln) amidotransferase subunit GatC [Spiroplasma taiwanense]|uniref:Glutamyl-tRNA(Gln) amidotransferase subunit C n=1 Tax=Spiroplasma taiwanense CT-1 TaxID=1276220 RepID=S5LT20_9MOLU|nr:Asp-tRNA(Asn)/Glu-tRNA(Gln) amidotransferase subunit GatC [Spiroplasma taiwanense]AGR40834.1 glutamyl-tRNA(Gln) amidotransferase subunit C [Spiroplasma taiwanense CT-1]
MKINIELIKALEQDAMLDLSDEELNKILKFENDILEKFEKVFSINTDNVKELYYPFEIYNTYLREDDNTSVISKEAILSNAIDSDEDFIVIAKVVK